MATFTLTPNALNDLRDIARYTQQQWGRDQRNHYLHEIDQRFHWLAKNPKLAAVRDDIKEGYRSYPQGKHVIFFREQKKTIEILAILHQRMDVKLQIGE